VTETFSRSGWTFAQVPIALIADRETSAEAKVLFSYLAWRQRKKDISWPGVARMAKDLSLSDRSIQRSLADLIKNGWLAVQERAGHSNQYTIYASKIGTQASTEPDDDGNVTPESGGYDGNVTTDGDAGVTHNDRRLNEKTQATRSASQRTLCLDEPPPLPPADSGVVEKEEEPAGESRAISARKRPTRKPKYVMSTTEPQRRELAAYFSHKSRLAPPELTSNGAFGAMYTVWDVPLDKVFVAAGADIVRTKALIDIALDKLKRATLKGPISIVAVAEANRGNIPANAVTQTSDPHVGMMAG
jgi:hypothetical protein